MDKLWAPWRMEYIQSLKEKGGCIFCKASEEKNDKENLVLYRGKQNFVILNRFPYNNGHVMVVPYEHTPDILALDVNAREDLMTILGRSLKVMKEKLGCEGFNCGMNLGRVAGAGIEDHFHLHVVPRWAGDTNFFPILAETKSMPEYLEKTYDRLIEGFGSMKSKIQNPKPKTNPKFKIQR